jgi:ribosome-associated protein
MDWGRILQELTFRTSRSSGAGGQHVNKTETRVEVIFHINDSLGLNEEEKIRIHQKLASRIYDSGELVSVASKSRSQATNKDHATERLRLLLEKALQPEKKRVRTKPSPESKEERLQEKKRNAEKKATRKKPNW